MIIPDRVVEVLRGPAFMQLGTRDAEMRPSHRVVVGAVVHDDRETVTFFLAEKRSHGPLANLQDNGRVALAMGIISHEAYQLKGRFISSRRTDERDVMVQEDYRQRLYAATAAAYPEEVARPAVFGVAYRPGVAVTFRVEEIFLQTPGPGAGTRMAPSPEVT